MNKKERIKLAEQANHTWYMLINSLRYARKMINEVLRELERGGFEHQVLFSKILIPLNHAVTHEAELYALVKLLKEQGMPELTPLGNDEAHQEYENRLRELFKEYNISEEKGFKLANEILDYALSLKLDGIDEETEHFDHNKTGE